MSQNIRKPAVAGQFYPADASRLEFKLKEYLNTASITKTSDNVKAIIVPHAGYDYSGAVAAYGYKELEGKSYDNVILIGNSHSAYFDGVAIDANDAWETPLGKTEVNQELAGQMAKADSMIKINSAVHNSEHSLEVQLPFLQAFLKPGFKLLPILFGNTHSDGYKKLAAILRNNLGGNDLIVISSDLSHYPGYDDANKIDNKTLELIKSKDIITLDDHIQRNEGIVAGEDTCACGIDAIRTVIEFANLLNWDAEILKYANSGDTAIGDKKRVVGYGAVVFFESHNSQLATRNVVNELSGEQKKKLLDIAKQTVEIYVREKKIPEFDIKDERLQWKEGAFVTLKKDEDLRGCIGQIVPGEDPLWEVVRDMAVAACSEDYRFNPVQIGELPFLAYEISVLSKPEVTTNWQDIKLGEHGVIVQKGARSGVFLPQVADETGWSLEEFMSELCSQKAGLPSDCYKNDPEVIIKVFTAQVF